MALRGFPCLHALPVGLCACVVHGTLLLLAFDHRSERLLRTGSVGVVSTVCSLISSAPRASTGFQITETSHQFTAPSTCVSSVRTWTRVPPFCLTVRSMDLPASARLPHTRRETKPARAEPRACTPSAGHTYASLATACASLSPVRATCSKKTCQSPEGRGTIKISRKS